MIGFMQSPKICPECGSPIPSDAHRGLCPKCVFGLASVAITADPPNDDNAADAGASRLVAAGQLSATDSLADLVPGTFGDYELLEEIGRGGMGVVYKARQLSLNRIVAVKMILAGQFAGKQLVQRFRGEAAAAGILKHPNIVSIHEIGMHGGQHFFSMDYVQGQNLVQLIGNRPLSAAKAARYVKLSAEAIHYAHGEGILHRDLKPSNVLIDANDQPRITDFGLAKRLDGESSITITGQALGSPSFMPPEQAGGNHGKVDRHSDVYGLGGMLYHLLTARAPFQAESLEAVVTQVIHTEPISLRLLNASVPSDLETICLKCLEKEPPQRYATAQALADELGRFLNHEPIQARPIHAPEKLWRWCRRKPVIATLGVATVILLLAVGTGAPIAAYRINQARKAEATERQRAGAEATARRGQLYAAEVNLAQEALAEANLGRARQLLERQRPVPGETNDLRGFEWRYVYGQCQSDELATLSRFDSPVTRVLFAPNGQWLAVTDGNGNARLWDHRTRREIMTLPAYTNLTKSGTSGDSWYNKGLAFSPDGKRLAVGVGNAIALWDLDALQQTVVLRGHTNFVRSVIFSPDGQTLASASRDGTARLWNVGLNPPVPGAILNVGFDVLCLAYSADGGLLVVGAAPNILRLWDVSTAAAPHELPPLNGHTAWVLSLAFSPVTNLLASSGSEIILFNLGSQGTVTSTRKLRDGRGSLGIIDSLTFDPDGQTLVSAGTDRNLTLWDLSGAGREPVKLKGHESEVGSVALTPDGQTMASASYDGTVKLWDPRWPIARPMSHGGFLYAVAFSPNSKLLASIAQSAKLKLWDVATERVVAEHDISQVGGIAQLAFSPDGRLLAADDSNRVRLFEVPALVEVTNFPGRRPFFSPSGTEVIYFRKGSVHRRNLTTHTEHAWKTGWSSVNTAALSLDGRRMAAAASGDLPQLRVWNAEAPDRRLELGIHAEIVSLSFSPDGNWLASASLDGTNRLWNLADSPAPDSFSGGALQPAVSLAAHNGAAWVAAFSSDSRTLATSGDDSTIRLWHWASLQQAATLRGHHGAVTALAFAPDGKHLASGGNDGTVRIWHAPTLAEIAGKQ